MGVGLAGLVGWLGWLAGCVSSAPEFAVGDANSRTRRNRDGQRQGHECTTYMAVRPGDARRDYMLLTFGGGGELGRAECQVSQPVD